MKADHKNRTAKAMIYGLGLSGSMLLVGKNNRNQRKGIISEMRIIHGPSQDPFFVLLCASTG